MLSANQQGFSQILAHQCSPISTGKATIHLPNKLCTEIIIAVIILIILKTEYIIFAILLFFNQMY